MNNETVKSRALRRQRSIQEVHYNLRQRKEVMAKPLTFLPEVRAYEQQVAGHRNNDHTKYLGLLQCNDGTILKPILKESQKREVDFYKRISSSTDADLVELRNCTPKFFGCRKYTYNGFELDYIVLEDLTLRMLEPCIMDVKIGKKTWDSLASEEKIKSEQSKYMLCKQQFGFCIPGMQVYRLATGQLLRYNKDYGKKLHGHMVRDAIRTYLNCSGGAASRALVLQQLGALWRLQTWARRQRALSLRAASLLLVYDAARLRASAAHTHTHTHTHSHSSPGGGGGGAWREALERVQATHSFSHNYEDTLSAIRANYRAALERLSDGAAPPEWGSVRLIDFAHAFFNDEEEMSVDHNFRDGLDSFVAIFEELLSETDDQVL